MVSGELKREKMIKRLLIFNLVAMIFALIALAVYWLIQTDDFKILRIFWVMFSDFSQTMQFALSKNPYQAPVSSSYPPLAIVICYVPALICRTVVDLSYTDIIKTPEFWMSFLLCYGICFIAIALLLKKLVGLRGKNFVFFILAVLTSGGVLFTLIRGNVVIFSFVFILFFIAFYNSKNKVLRELALIALALAGAVKIYPLFFGVLLLRERKLFQAARVGIYTVFLFFMPFLFFEGGFLNIQLFLANLTSFSVTDGRLLNMLSLSAAGLVYKFFYVIAWPFGISLARAGEIVSIFVIAAVVIVAVTGSLLAKSKLSVYIICAAAIILIPPVSYYYSVIFLLIPMTEFAREYQNSDAKTKRRYAVFFMAFSGLILCLLSVVLSLLLTVVLFYVSVKNIKIYFEERKVISKGGNI